MAYFFQCPPTHIRRTSALIYSVALSIWTKHMEIFCCLKGWCLRRRRRWALNMPLCRTLLSSPHMCASQNHVKWLKPKWGFGNLAVNGIMTMLTFQNISPKKSQHFAIFMGCRHSSGDKSVPPILPPGFESQTHHLHFYQFIFEYCHVEKTKINKKRPGFGHFKKTFCHLWVPFSQSLIFYLLSKVKIAFNYLGRLLLLLCAVTGSQRFLTVC